MPRRALLTGSIALSLLLSACSLTFWKQEAATPSGSSATGGVSAQELVRDMQAKMTDLTSAAVESTVTVDVSEKETKEAMKIALGLSGKVDSRKDDDQRAALTLTADLQGSASGQNLTGNITLDTAIIAKDIYLRISRLTAPPDFEAFLPQVQPYLNKWWLFANAVEDAASAAKSESDLSSIFAGENATEEQKQAMRTLVAQTNFFDASMDSDTVEVGSVETTKVNVGLNKKEIVTFAKEAAKIMKEDLSTADITELEKNLDEIVFSGALYIGVDDHLLYKVTGSVEPTPTSSIREDGMFSIALDVTLSKHNANQDITAPVGAEAFDPSAFQDMMAPQPTYDDAALDALPVE